MVVQGLTDGLLAVEEVVAAFLRVSLFVVFICSAKSLHNQEPRHAPRIRHRQYTQAISAAIIKDFLDCINNINRHSLLQFIEA